ncbi:hypothetical protein DLJ53_17470 [Acuticoccus sediminis]|uniref:Uncharacterized protein n=1 Tax=Acuticoccus sediminis TaxID=2184697 RepID=A0A8B2NV17_9HYPH|nr:hypothetical protein [Acuticoccus sediminis]RAI01013.1 hypothetical protein DLJ53_17470 [Acuticoccus sediminis]
MAKDHDLALRDICDEYCRLEDRIRFYTAGAESIAGDALDGYELDPLLRASTDLREFAAAFKVLLNDYHEAQKVAKE